MTLHILTASALRVAALLAGDMQVIENVPNSNIKKLLAGLTVSIFKIPVFRIMYLHVDLNRDVSSFVTNKTGKPLPKDSLKDARVREAISLAILHQTIVDRVVEGAAEPTGQLINSALFDHMPGLKAPVTDLPAAKRLLTQAGYPDGFAIMLHAANNRYPSNDRVAQVIASMLSWIGITTEVETLPSASFFTRTNRLNFPFLQAGQEADTGGTNSSLKALLTTFDPTHSWGTSSHGRCSDSALDARLTETLQTLDDSKRERLLQEATGIEVRDDGVIPLYFNINVQAAHKDYTVMSRLDERTYMFDAVH